jgi:hypothetical protein
MKPVPRKAFEEVSGFEAKKHAIRQTTDGLWQLTLTIHEFGTADWLVFAPTGMPLAIGLKALDYDNPQEPEQQENPNKRYIQRSVMLCKDERFQKYMERRASEEGFYDWGMDTPERETSNALRTYLGLDSRSELGAVHNDAVRFQMDTLVNEFRESLKQR